MRGKQAPKRVIEPDPKYHDVDVAKFINYIMIGGKKATAQRVLYDAFEIVRETTKQDPRHVFNKACPLAVRRSFSMARRLASNSSCS